MCSFNADVLTMHDVLEGRIPVYHKYDERFQTIQTLRRLFVTTRNCDELIGQCKPAVIVRTIYFNRFCAHRVQFVVGLLTYYVQKQIAQSQDLIRGIGDTQMKPVLAYRYSKTSKTNKIEYRYERF
jgi:hypothetical protein